MNLTPTIPSQLKLGSLPDNYRFLSNSSGKNNGNPNTIANTPLSAISTAEMQQAKSSPDPKSHLYYLIGTTGALLEVVAGGLFIASSLKAKKNPVQGDKLAKYAGRFLATGSTIAIPMEIGAAIKSKQPGMLLSSVLWGVGGLSFFKNDSTRIKGFYSLAYAPSFASFANEIHNDYRRKEGDPHRSQEIDFKNPISLLTFCVKDQARAAKKSWQTIKDTASQGMDYLSGQTKKLPYIFSTRPSKESMSLASSFVVMGSVAKLVFGKALGRMSYAADFMIGSGMVFDTLGMMSLANAKNDTRKPVLLAGGPLRIFGDFFQENRGAYGLRTIGGAACMYYWAGIHKEEDDEPKKAQTQPAVTLRTKQSPLNSQG